METRKLTNEQVQDIMNYLGDGFEELNTHIEAALTSYEWYEGESDEAVYKFYVDFGRMGDLEGIFTAKKKDVEWLLNCEYEVYFGEVLGKHSEIYFRIREEHLEMLTDDPKAVKNCRNSGYNPFDYTLLSGKEEWEDLSVNEIIELEERNLWP